MTKLEDTFVNVLQVMKEQTVKMVSKNKEQKSTGHSVSILGGRSQRPSCQMSKYLCRHAKFLLVFQSIQFLFKLTMDLERNANVHT